VASNEAAAALHGTAALDSLAALRVRRSQRYNHEMAIVQAPSSVEYLLSMIA
jgi:hypothetical protein